MSTGTTELLVRQQRLESDGVLSLVLEHPDGRELPAWTPGAHIDVVLPSGAVRQYSLCSDPMEKTKYRIAVLNDPNSRGGSREIHETVRTGGLLQFRGPRNHFELEPAQHYLLIAGGIGITPILAMARQIAQGDAGLTLLYGGRTRRSMAFVDELAGLGGTVSIIPKDECGYADLESAMAAAPAGTAVYCCGPEPLIRAVEQACERHLGANAMHFERFGAAASLAAAGDAASRAASPEDTTTDEGLAEFEVELKQSNCVLKVPADRTLLDVVRDANPSILFSCEEGFCGSCETKVLAGIPDHRDTILSKADREKNDTMMLCVGRSKTPLLVLDA
ncbi:ferredoxin-NADP reductase [Arthrobacter sp. GAS37]|uniref:PDR/VanB family oxidoreductase n=1 Tax=Arthrobacter sp. GAS37 TaxID=3156261 RepID=UPI003839553A